jgi:hypothetical protein
VSEPIVMMVEELMTEEEVVLVVRHLQGQGFLVEVSSIEPMVLVLTCPSDNDSHLTDN